MLTTVEAASDELVIILVFHLITRPSLGLGWRAVETLFSSPRASMAQEPPSEIQSKGLQQRQPVFSRYFTPSQARKHRIKLSIFHRRIHQLLLWEVGTLCHGVRAALEGPTTSVSVSTRSKRMKVAILLGEPFCNSLNKVPRIQPCEEPLRT